MKKRIFAQKLLSKSLSLVLVLTLILTGCGSENKDPETGGAKDAEESALETDEESASDTDDTTGDISGDTEEGDETNDDPFAYIDENTVSDPGFELEEITMLKGEKLELESQFSEKYDDVSFISSDEDVVKVSKNGTLIKAKKKGKATLLGRTADDTYRFICRVTVKKKPKSIIYLTFDDGPSRYSTPKVLEILKDNDIKATFFELNPAKEDYDLTQRVIDEGHTLAIHGYSHIYSKIYTSDKTYKKNLTKLQSKFFKKFGVWCTQTRFPGGSSNTVSRNYSKGIMSRLVKKVHKWGFTYQDWNVSSGDAGGAKTADDVYNYVVSGLQKGRSNVVLMHDYSGNDKTINALQRVIDYGKDNGYTFLPMTAATTEVIHGTNN